MKWPTCRVLFRLSITITICLLPSLAALPAYGQDAARSAAGSLIVGTKHSPPFAFKNSEGQWTGISIELWRHMANDLGLKYEFREQTLDELFVGLESGELDAAVAAISVTAERHERVEFCHPHFTTGLGIAVPNRSQPSTWRLFRRIASSQVLLVAAAMIGIVLFCGGLFWLCERNRNESMFGGRRRQGLGMGVWWATTLLLGHKGVVPASTWGRVLAASSMLASILLLSILTGVIASVLTVRQLDAGIKHPSDLRGVRVVTVAPSTSEDYLRGRRISFQKRNEASAALTAVVDGNADAVVYDEALLKYLAKLEFPATIQVLPVSFNTQEYAIALPAGSQLRKRLNRSLLRYRASDRWDEMIYRYLGE